MQMLKRLGVFALLGAVLGNAVATLVAPGLLGWYSTGAYANAQCICTEVAEATTKGLLQAQLWGTLIGVAVLVALGIVLEVKGRKKPGVLSPPPVG